MIRKFRLFVQRHTAPGALRNPADELHKVVK
jgi:hypothetical protein